MTTNLFCMECGEWVSGSSHCVDKHNTLTRIDIELIEDGPKYVENWSTRSGHVPRRRFSGASCGGIGQPKSVMYIEGFHEKEEVLRAWIEENRERLEETGVNNSSFLQRVSSEFEGVWKSLRHEYDFVEYRERATGGGVPSSRICPLCGEEIDSRLPEHIQYEH